MKKIIVPIIILLFGCILLINFAAGKAAAVSNTVTLYGHGFVGSVGCPNAATTAPALDTVLTAKGYSKQVGINWLCGDKGGLDVKPYGRIPTANYNANAQIEDIAYAVAWAIYTNYSSQGIHVNYIGHSMGGLYWRYALTRVGVDPSFPPYLLVDHTVTYSTPYKGWDINPGLMGITCGPYKQCEEMKPGSAFLNELTTHTSVVGMWACVGGSPKDTVATINSACGVNADRKIDYYDKTVVNYSHPSYMTDPSLLNNVKVKLNGVIITGFPHSLAAGVGTF